jgi:hypothetical protein
VILASDIIDDILVREGVTSTDRVTIAVTL